MRDFMDASTYTWESADALLRDLEQDGLVVVREKREGIVRTKEILLTDVAREIVKQISPLEELHKRAKDLKKRSAPR